jgi:hypothetical protein
MGFKIGYRHLAAGNKSNEPRAQSDRYEDAAAKFDNPSQQHQRTGCHDLATQCSKQLLGPMACKKRPDKQAHYRIEYFRVFPDPTFHCLPPLSRMVAC